MKPMHPRLRAAILAAGVMFAMSAALHDQSVAFALGVAAFSAFGGFSSGRSRGE